MDTDSPNARRPLTYGRQSITEGDLDAVLGVLRGHWLTQGPEIERFEADLCAAFGTAHAVVCSNGTTALHLAAQVLGWGEGDVIIVPAITFAASANCCRYVGAEPYFVDIDDDTLTIDLNEVEAAVIRLRTEGRRVKGIVAVDFAGHPCDWPGLRQLADRFELDLVDDACHALGATYDGGVRVGSCTHNHITTLSFHPVKHITTGEGGALLTNDAALAARAARLRTHGIERSRELMADWEGPWSYDMVELGNNYRMTDMQAALGRSQLQRLPVFVDQRRQRAARYRRQLSGSEAVRLQAERADCVHAYHLFVARCDFARGGTTRPDLYRFCQEREILLQVHYRPVYMNTYYRDQPLHHDAAHRTPVARRYYEETVSLPMFYGLSDADVDYVVDTLLAGLASR